MEFLILSAIAARIAHDATFADGVFAGLMDMPVDPQVGLRHQRVACTGVGRRSRMPGIAVGYRARGGSVMGDDHRFTGEGPGQLLGKPARE